MSATLTVGRADLTPGEAYLYVVEIIGRGVKVGISTDPARRIKQHDRDACAYGASLGRVWVSPLPHGNARSNEKSLIGNSKREYIDADFDAVVAIAETLPILRIDPADVTRRSDAFVDAFRGFIMGGAR